MARIIVDKLTMKALCTNMLLLITLVISVPSMSLENISMKGFVRGEHLQRIGNQDVFEEKTQSSLGSTVDGKIELDWAYEDFSIDTISYGKYRSRYHNNDTDMEHDAEIREWVFGYESENWQYRLGKQQIAWGKGDYFRIIDVINPLDLTESLIPYLDDYSLGRLPREMLVVEYFQDDIEYQFITAFKTQRTEYPEPGTDFSITGLPSNSASADTDNIDLALRIRFFIDSTDIDLYAFSGYSPDSLFTLEEDNSQTTIQEHLEKRNVIAVSFARPIAFGVLRSDMAYYLDETIQSSNTFERISKLEGLIGLDIIEDEWTYNLQASVSQVYGESDAFSSQKNTKSASASIQKEWSRQRLTSSLLWLYSDSNRSSNMLKYNVKYDWRSDSQFEIGLIAYDGPVNSLYGMYDDQDRVYINFKQSF